MFSKLRKSFRRKSARYHSRQDSGHDDDVISDVSSLRRQSTGGSFSSLDSSFTSVSSVSPRERGVVPSPPNPNCVWQKVTPSVTECNRTMFNRQLNCDVMFVVGEGRGLVGAHRFVLVSRSDVLFRMFCGPLAETGPVVIPDVTEDLFRQFLQFLYVDEVSLTADSVTPLHYLARKYNVEPLVQLCLEFMHARLTYDNACSILEQAHCFDEHELFKASFEFVKEHAQACLSSASAVHDLCRDCFRRLLSVDDLPVSELVLFNSALSWAETSLHNQHATIDAVSVRHQLQDLRHLIRFPAMTFTLLRERVFPTEILTPEEIKVVTEYKTGSRTSAAPFCSRGRLREVHRFQTESRVRCSNQTEGAKWTAAITFTCDRHFNLHALHVFCCTRASQQASLSFSVLEGQDQLDLFNRMTHFHHSHSLQPHVDAVKTLSITMETPLALRADVDYTLVLQADMATCYCGSDGMAYVTGHDANFRFKNAPLKMNGTTVTEGQIPCLVYSVRC